MTRPLRERRPHEATGPSYLAALLELRERDQKRNQKQRPTGLRAWLRRLRSAA